MVCTNDKNNLKNTDVGDVSYPKSREKLMNRGGSLSLQSRSYTSMLCIMDSGAIEITPL